MKRLTTLILVCGLILAIGGPAAATQIWDRPEYRPSSNLVLNGWGSEWGGSEGYIIAQDFQLNLLYQAPYTQATINAYNDYNRGDGFLNFHDPEEYVFKWNINGNLPVYTYPDIEVPGGSTIQWTLTGWHQTILAGGIIEQSGATYFQILPIGTYRPFPNEQPVNAIEVFTGPMASQVLGYTFNGTLSELGSGDTLNVNLVPTPAPTTLLLLGTGLLGLALLGRRKWRGKVKQS